MTIEQILADHYADVDIDDTALARLRSTISTLSARTEKSNSQPRSAARRPALAAAAVVVLAAAGATLIPSAMSDGTGSARADTFIEVRNPDGVDGLVRQRDIRDVTDPRTSHSDQGREELSVVVSLFSRTDRQVIGEWSPTHTGTELPIRCPHADGIAFTAPATGRTGESTPVAAARNLDRDLGLSGFGNSDSTWTVRSRTTTSATLVSATTTLYASTLPDGTWAITGGRRCQS